MYGCRVVQKVLETVGKEEQKLIIMVSSFKFYFKFVVSSQLIWLQKLESNIEEFVKDQNGNHVIQKCIEVVEPLELQFILDAFKNKVIFRYIKLGQL